jgi:hypothetical protein
MVDRKTGRLAKQLLIQVIKENTRLRYLLIATDVVECRPYLVRGCSVPSEHL